MGPRRVHPWLMVEVVNGLSSEEETQVLGKMTVRICSLLPVWTIRVTEGRAGVGGDWMRYWELTPPILMQT